MPSLQISLGLVVDDIHTESRVRFELSHLQRIRWRHSNQWRSESFVEAVHLGNSLLVNCGKLTPSTLMVLRIIPIAVELESVCIRT